MCSTVYVNGMYSGSIVRHEILSENEYVVSLDMCWKELETQTESQQTFIINYIISSYFDSPVKIM
jgi:hypothetical protein